MPITEQEIRATAERLKAYTAATEDATRNEAAARQALADARNTIMLRYADPKELGSNEAQRNAALAAKTEAELEDVRRFEEQASSARAELAIVQIDWSMCQKLVDLALATNGEVA